MKNFKSAQEFLRDVEQISDADLPTYLPSVALKLSNDEIDAVHFVYWLTFLVEKQMKDVVDNYLKRTGCSSDLKDLIDDIYDELTIYGKIKILEKQLKRSEGIKSFKKLFSFYTVLKEMRNNMAHCKIERLLYKGKNIQERKTKNLMLVDYYEATKGVG